jgi:hypothetical protein
MSNCRRSEFSTERVISSEFESSWQRQIGAYARRAPKRPHLNNTDRFLLVRLYRWFPSIPSAIAIVGPETIIRCTAPAFGRIGAGGLANPVGQTEDLG